MCTYERLGDFAITSNNSHYHFHIYVHIWSYLISKANDHFLTSDFCDSGHDFVISDILTGDHNSALGDCGSVHPLPQVLILDKSFSLSFMPFIIIHYYILLFIVVHCHSLFILFHSLKCFINLIELIAVLQSKFNLFLYSRCK